MALSAEVKRDAKRYNAEYDLFKAVRQNDGETKWYASYGVAYRYTSAKVRRGENWRVYGVRNFVEPRDGSFSETVELIAC